MPYPDVHYEEIKKKLEATEKELLDLEISNWLIPKCPKCNGILSAYCFTEKLICLKCQSIYTLNFVGTDK
jgi:phage FluMu protein Com